MLKGTFAVEQEQADGTFATRIARANDTVAVPPGTAHTFWNADADGELVFRFTLTPANPTGEHFFENIAGLRRDGADNPLSLLAVFDAGGIDFAEPPPGLLRKATNFRLLGFPSAYRAYTYPCFVEEEEAPSHCAGLW